MSILRALIVDDEPLARERLRGMLRTESTIEVVGECTSGTEAIASIRNQGPDLVFLDMQLPGCDGLEVIAKIPEEIRPGVIFVTAHERFALDAFAVRAIDYLLKPFDRERLQMAVRRAGEQLGSRRLSTVGPAEQPSLPDSSSAEKKNGRLTVKSEGRFVFLWPNEIIWVEADDNHVILHLIAGTLKLRETMASIETRLGTAQFARVNRSAIVHLDQIKELRPTFQGDYTVLLNNGIKLPLSRSQRDRLIGIASGSLPAP